MPFNDRKAIKINYGGNVVGCYRIIRPAYKQRQKVMGYIVLFLQRCSWTDDVIVQRLYEEACFVAKHLAKNRPIVYRIVLPVLPPYTPPDTLWQARLVNQFGSTALQRSSSVLIDEETGKPLF